MWKRLFGSGLGLLLAAVAGAPAGAVAQERRGVAPPYYGAFDVRVLVDGRPLEEYPWRGRHYVEARRGAEYAVQIRNPLPVRVAVALSVDGLNTIDARRTTGWEASKWVIEPYQTITVTGWQMSSSRARRFYFTTERDSYAAKLGRPADVGLITAVFFREARPEPSVITPAPRDREYRAESRDGAPEAQSSAPARSRSGRGVVRPDDDYAATGIGRSVHNDVRWVSLPLDPRPVAELNIRYEYREALVRLGILPRPYVEPDPLRRRERARGFEDTRFCPEP